MAQLIAEVDDGLLEAIDNLVATGLLASRSEAVRRGLETLVNKEHARKATGESIVAGYRHTPQGDGELAAIDAGTQAMVEQEPW